MTIFAGNIIRHGCCNGCQEYADPFDDQGRCVPCALFHAQLNGGTLPCDHFILSYQQIITSDIAGGSGEVDIFYQCLGSCKSASLFPPYHAEYDDPPIIWLLPEVNSPEVQQTRERLRQAQERYQAQQAKRQAEIKANMARSHNGATTHSWVYNAKGRKVCGYCGKFYSNRRKPPRQYQYP